MFTIILQSTLLFWVTAADLLLVLSLLFVKFPIRQHPQIRLGQILGSGSLVLTAIVFALVFHFIPAAWILGFLGLIPIGYGLKFLIFGDDDEEDIDENLAKHQNRNLTFNIMILTYASCGADDIGLFTPFFAQMKTSLLPIGILAFIVNIVLLGFVGRRLSLIGWLHNFLKKYSRWIIGTVYIALGLLVIIQGGTVQEILSWF